MNYINTECPQKNKLKSKISSDFAMLDKLVNSYDYQFIRWKGETDILGLNWILPSPCRLTLSKTPFFRGGIQTAKPDKACPPPFIML